MGGAVSGVDTRRIQVRGFMNWIKAVAIETACESARGAVDDRGAPGGLAVVDIGCGRGGDAAKFRRAGATRYLGVDISAAAVAEARRRPPPCDGAHASYAVFDAGSRAAADEARGTDGGALLRPGAADVAVSMLAIHHAFSTDERGEAAMDVLCDPVRPGGCVAVVFPEGVALRRALDNGGAHNDFVRLSRGASDRAVQFVVPGASGMSGEEPLLTADSVRRSLQARRFEVLLDATPRSLRSRFSDRRAQRRVLRAPERLDRDQWVLADLYAVIVARKR